MKKQRIIQRKIKQNIKEHLCTIIEGAKGTGKSELTSVTGTINYNCSDKKVVRNIEVGLGVDSSFVFKKSPVISFDECFNLIPCFKKLFEGAKTSASLPSLVFNSSKALRLEQNLGDRADCIKLYPLSLFESGESNGSAGLKDLFSDVRSFGGCQSVLDIEDYAFLCCRGGWPASFEDDEATGPFRVSRDLYRWIYSGGLEELDGQKKDPAFVKEILKGYAKSLCSFRKNTALLKDMPKSISFTAPSFRNYVSSLEDAFFVDNIEAWAPPLKSRSALLTLPKKNLVDPSLGAAALQLEPAELLSDLGSLESYFKSLCVRDLRVYSSLLGGEVRYYADRTGLNVDVVLILREGSYGLINIRLGDGDVEDASRDLLALEGLIRDYNRSHPRTSMPLPNFRMVLTASHYGYLRDDGTAVVPLGALRD